MKRLSVSFLLTIFLGCVSANETTPALKKQNWSFDGPFGTYSKDALQRGFQVYQEVCSACHGMKLLSYRHLKDLGYTEAQIKAIAAKHDITAGPNEQGEMFTKKAQPHDRLLSPFANDQAARAANNGSLPADLSLIVKARKRGADYVYSLLTGYQDPPKDVVVGENMYYNPFMSGGQIAMPPPLKEGMVTFSDGTPSTVDQMSKDVTTFLAFASEPEATHRKSLGIKVMFYLLVLTTILYFSKRKIWKDLK